MQEMTPRDKFLFDLQGFLVMKGFLSTHEVDTLNQAVDANHHRIVVDGNQSIGNSTTLAGTTKRQIMGDMLRWPEPWAQPFRDLLAHPSQHDVGSRLEARPPPRHLHGPAGAEGLILHGTGLVIVDPSVNCLEVPRDRNGEFDPRIVPKHARRLEGFNERIIALYGRGMTVRDIQDHLAEMYDVEVSPVPRFARCVRVG